jgi:mRNA interferase RelE/StbE
MYRLFLTEEFDRCLGKISKSARAGIEKKIIAYVGPQLKQEPHFGLNIKKLRGYDPETWRYRIGRFRVFYLIDEKDRIVKVLSIEQRKDAY